MKTPSVYALIVASLLAMLGTTIPLADDPDDEEIHQTVARVSWISGDVSLSRGDDPDDWQAADINVPMTLGDRLYAGLDGRFELQISGGNYARIGSGTDLTALNMTDETKQFSITEGVASFQIRRFDEDEILEVDTPNAAVTFERAGEYRISVDHDGNTRVGILRGRATVSAGGGEVSLNAGDEMDVDGIDNPQYDVVSIGQPDSFDGWVLDRERRLERVSSYRYVSPDVVGAEDLDEYGRWVPMPGYGMVWTPTVVMTGWSPYSQGHWVWQDPWGWTWVAAEPWGWAPYHYGRWFEHDARWYWAPVPPSAPRVRYAPALVAFVGGGPGGPRGGVSLSVSIGSGGGAIGWFPLAPADPLIPWWGSRRQVNVTNVQVTNVKYVNKTHITVINQNTFVSGGLVQNNRVRDETVIREVRSEPIASGPLPVPTRASLRVSVKTNVAPAPPEPIVSRHVVARIAPPPAPPRFERKQKLIEQNQGAPVAPVVAARLAVEEQGGPRARVTVRPVAEQSGEVKLRSRGKARGLGAPQPAEPIQPVRPVRGRPMATQESPVQPQQTPAQAAPPPSTPSGPAQTPVEGREGRGTPPGRERNRPQGANPPGQPPNQPPGTPNQAQPPNRGPNRQPAARPNQPQPPAGQGKQNQDDQRKKNKKRKGGRPEDPNAPPQ